MTDDGAEVERRVVAVLDGLGVPYELQPIDPAFADTAAYCERYGVPLDHAANTIIVVSKKEPRQYAACVVAFTTHAAYWRGSFFDTTMMVLAAWSSGTP